MLGRMMYESRCTPKEELVSSLRCVGVGAVIELNNLSCVASKRVVWVMITLLVLLPSAIVEATWSPTTNQGKHKA